MAEAPQSDETSGNHLVTRRQMVSIGGVTLVATSVGLSGCASVMNTAGLPIFPRADPGAPIPTVVAGAPIGTLGGGTKPIFVAQPGSRDPVAHSVADTLFWGEQMMEHAMFIAMLMPGPELATQRAQAEQYQQQFAAHLAKLRSGRLDAGNYAAFNRKTTSLTRSLLGYKQAMEDAQESGRIRSLVWPSFFDHTRKEGERFAARLDQLNRGDTTYVRGEVIPFWADKMEEHSLFIDQLLDPDETLLKKVSQASATSFAKMEAAPPAREPALAAAQTIIDFKTAAEKGIISGQIKSIINPALADHVRREAVRFKDELMRAA